MTGSSEWTRKGAVITDGTACKDYGVTRDFLVQGIRAGKLDYRDSVIYGNPCFKILRSQLERYIAEQLGSEQLDSKKIQTELRKINKEIGSLKRKLAALETRKTEIVAAIGRMRDEG